MTCKIFDVTETCFLTAFKEKNIVFTEEFPKLVDLLNLIKDGIDPALNSKMLASVVLYDNVDDEEQHEVINIMICKTT